MENTLIRPTGKRSSISDDDLSQLVQWFEDSEETCEEARNAANGDRDYYDGKQLTNEEIQTLRDRGQPDIIINRIGPKVDTACGLEIQQRSDPKAYPRNKKDEEASEAATDALRYIKDREDLDGHFSEGWKQLQIEGIEALEVQVKNTKSGTVEIDIKSWEYERLFYDPHSRKHDFSDARYMGGIIWSDADQLKKTYGDKADLFDAMISEAATSKSFDDKPSHKKWVDGKQRKRIRIVQIYWLDGEQWKWSIFTKGGELEGGDVEYVNSDGESVNPMIMQSAYVDRDNNRYGPTRRLKGPQDEINKRRSKLLHQLTVRQTWGEDGAVDVKEAKRELARADGHVTVNPGLKFEVIDNTQQTSGQAELLQEAKSEIDAQGANASLQGTPEGDPSGRAIIAKQQGGILEQTPLSERHKQYKRRVYRAIWDRVRQYWKAERWVRVTDNEDNVKFVGLNEKIKVGQLMRRKLAEQGHNDEEIGAAMAAAEEKEENLDEVTTVNVPAEMDMDIIIEEGPDTVTIQQEQFAEISSMAQAGVPFTPRQIIKSSQLRNKDELLEEMEGAGQKSEAEQLIEKLTIEKLQNENEKLKSEIEKNRATGIKSLTDADAVDGVIGNLSQQVPVATQPDPAQQATPNAALV